MKQGIVERLFKMVATVAGIFATVFAFFLIRKKQDEKETRVDTRKDVEDRVRATRARTVTDQYDGVGEIIEDGRNRFAARVKDRILEAGGSRPDGKHTD